MLYIHIPIFTGVYSWYMHRVGPLCILKQSISKERQHSPLISLLQVLGIMITDLLSNTQSANDKIDASWQICNRRTHLY